jgi:Tfp pilus assembly protein PilF
MYHALCCFVIALVCLPIYANTLNTPFVFDDVPNIQENSFIRITDLGIKGLYEAGFKSPCSNRPLANITFALNYYFGRYDVVGYHAANILIHLINGVLVYVLAGLLYRRVTPQGPEPRSTTTVRGGPWMALFAALIFVAHPIQTQSVTYIVQRMNSLAAMFYLMAFILYAKGREAENGKERWLLFLGGLLSWLLALGSKEIAVTLPVTLFLYECFFLQDLRSDWLKRNWRHFIEIAVIVGVLAMIYLKGEPLEKILATYRYRDFTLGERVLTQFRVVVFYMSLVLFPLPSRLNLLHLFGKSQSMFNPITTFLSMLIIVSMICFSIKTARKERLTSFCILWFFIHLVLESSIIGLEMIFEHRLYLPLFGFGLMLPYLLSRMLSKRIPLAHVALAAIVLCLAVGTTKRNAVWKDTVTLWSDVLKKNPKSHRAHNDLAIALKKRGSLDQAVFHYKEALKLNPGDAKAHNNLGNALREQGRFQEAIEHLSEAVRIRPGYPEAHNNLGIAFKMQGKLDEAIEQYSEALRLRPDYAEAYNNLGNAFAARGLFEEAIARFSDALRFKPKYAEAHNNLGNALASTGRFEEAIQRYYTALRIQPRYARAYNNLGVVLLRVGRLDEAVESYKKALMISPHIAETHNNLGVALFRQGRYEEALGHFSEALSIKSDYVEARRNAHITRQKILMRKKNHGGG